MTGCGARKPRSGESYPVHLPVFATRNDAMRFLDKLTIRAKLGALVALMVVASWSPAASVP
jgi:hypothetical protein